MKKIHIVLYSPEIPQNTGNISRTAVVTGCSLHIIRPIGFEISDRTLKRAGLDYWQYLDVRYYDSFQELLDKYNIKYLYSNFKKDEGYKHSIELSKEYGLYRQDYCGCIYSLKESVKNDI